MSNKSLIQADLLGMNVTWFLKDLKLYDNQSGLLESLIFTAARLLIFFMAVIVHRAFYKMMQRLPDRPLNQMIYPYMVSTYLHRYISEKNRRSLKFILNLNNIFFPDLCFFIHGSQYIVLHHSLLGIPNETFHRRNWLQHCNVDALFSNCGNSTSFIFNGHISLHLCLSWQHFIET